MSEKQHLANRRTSGMFRLLRSLGLNRVMIWPMTELAPPPLSAESGYLSEELARANVDEMFTWNDR